jgi:hypothetical protein
MLPRSFTTVPLCIALALIGYIATVHFRIAEDDVAALKAAALKPDDPNWGIKSNIMSVRVGVGHALMAAVFVGVACVFTAGDLAIRLRRCEDRIEVLIAELRQERDRTPEPSAAEGRDVRGG